MNVGCWNILFISGAYKLCHMWHNKGVSIFYNLAMLMFLVYSVFASSETAFIQDLIILYCYNSLIYISDYCLAKPQTQPPYSSQTNLSETKIR